MTIPKLTPPTIHEEPEWQASGVPRFQVITMGNDKASGDPGIRLIVEICEQYEEARKDVSGTFDTAEVVFKQYGLSELDSCGFAIYGVDAQSELSTEQMWNEMTGFIKALQIQLREYRQALIDQYRITEEGAEDLKRQLARDPP